MVEYCRKSGFIGKPKNDTGSASGYGGGHSHDKGYGSGYGGYNKGKGVMGSSSRPRQEATTVAEFALPELTLLIEILKEINHEDLKSYYSFIEIFSQYSVEFGFNMENQPKTKEKLEKVIDFYRKKADVVFDKLKNDDPQTHFSLGYNGELFYCIDSSINVYLLTFARKLIRSFFDFHAENKYYDNHVATINRQDCQELYSKCMDDRGYNQFLPFYFYFKKLGEELQIKLEQYLINPFLTEKDYEGYRIQMFKHYMERDLNSRFIGKPKNATGSTSDHGGGHSHVTKHGRSHDGYPGNY
uniref:Uncharacterized protein n=1 Tax=Meloidogyne floridensis TaxID=298350 RepID=A0A915PFW3_9BILA